MPRAKIRRHNGRWEVTYDGRIYAWMGTWKAAYRHAVCVVETIRRGEPTA